MVNIPIGMSTTAAFNNVLPSQIIQVFLGVLTGLEGLEVRRPLGHQVLLEDPIRQFPLTFPFMRNNNNPIFWDSLKVPALLFFQEQNLRRGWL